MEVKDWTPAEKDSFTTPGGPFRVTEQGAAKTYAFDRAAAPRQGEPVQPAPRTEIPSAAREPSPFAPGAAARPWYADVEGRQPAAPAVMVSHDGQTGTAVPLQPQITGGPQIYTIQLPASPRQPAPKQRSLLWLPLVLIAVLLVGLIMGILAYPLLAGVTEPVGTQSLPREDGETAAARVYRENLDAVVSVIVGPATADSDPVSTVATGFVIRSDGCILTNAHVVRSVDSSRDLTVKLSDGRAMTARVLALEETASDLALLKIEATGLQTVTFGDSDSVRVGDPVFTIGNPLGDLNYSLSAGYLSAGPRQIDTGTTTLTMLQTNAAINRGNSGGPLFDAGGKVIGVVTAKISSTDGENAVEGLGFALPSNDVTTFVESWLEDLNHE